MRTTEMVLIVLFLKTSKFLPASVSIYMLSLTVGVTVSTLGNAGIPKLVFYKYKVELCFFVRPIKTQKETP